MKISTILDHIDSGHMALPEFQRGYVWNRDQVNWEVLRPCSQEVAKFVSPVIERAWASALSHHPRTVKV